MRVPGDKKWREERSARPSRPVSAPDPEICVTQKTPLVSPPGKERAASARRDARSRGNLAQTAHLAPTIPTFDIAGIETTLKRSCWVVGLTGSPSWTARGRAWSSWAMSPSTSVGRSTRSSATILRAVRTRSGGDTTTDSNIRVSHRPPMANRGRDRPSRASLPRCPNRDPWRLFTPRAPQENPFGN